MKGCSKMLFRNSIEPSCAYCRHGSSLGFEEVACSKRGIMTTEGKCTLFRYEPTKRKPEYRSTQAVNEISIEDMSL